MNRLTKPFSIRGSAFLIGMIVTMIAVAGCNRKGSAVADGGDKSEGHDHVESPSGASFKENKGISFTDETRKNVGVEIADVVKRQLPGRINLTVQVFGEKHHHALNISDHSGCDVHGSGFLSESVAAKVKPGQPVELFKETNAPLSGVVFAVQKALAIGESEVVVGISNALAVLKAGEFVPARITLPRVEAVMAIPRAALLRTSEGTFVYAVNGDAFLRTPVKIGVEADGWVEITDGLLDGDQIVTKPVETLWLIELRATKGGGHCH